MRGISMQKKITFRQFILRTLFRLEKANLPTCASTTGIRIAIFWQCAEKWLLTDLGPFCMRIMLGPPLEKRVKRGQGTG